MPFLHNAPLIVVLIFVSPLLLLSWGVESFSPPRISSAPAISSAHERTSAESTRYSHRRRSGGASLFMSSSALALDDEDDDEMEWVEEEFELLTERDFYNTEWKIGTIMENKPREAKSIGTTWVRLVTTEDGSNKAIWGDDSKGKWNFDVPSQFFSISKETFGGWFGKQIWACTVEDFYYLDGTVRGWSPISAASVDGQWQGIRLGVLDGERVTVDERGEAPWFMTEDDSVDEDEDNEVEGSVEEEDSINDENEAEGNGEREDSNDEASEDEDNADTEEDSVNEGEDNEVEASVDGQDSTNDENEAAGNGESEDSNDEVSEDEDKADKESVVGEKTQP